MQVRLSAVPKAGWWTGVLRQTPPDEVRVLLEPAISGRGYYLCTP